MMVPIGTTTSLLKGFKMNTTPYEEGFNMTAFGGQWTPFGCKYEFESPNYNEYVRGALDGMMDYDRSKEFEEDEYRYA